MKLLLLALLQPIPESPSWIPVANFDSPVAAAVNWAGEASRCLRDVQRTGDAAPSPHCTAMYLLGDIYKEVAENHPRLMNDEVRALAAAAEADSNAAIRISRQTYEARLRAREVQTTPASPAAPRQSDVVYYRRPGDPPDPAALAAAERLLALMIPQGGLVSLMLPEILAAAPFPTPPGANASPAAQEAYRRAQIVANITQQELSSAYAEAEPTLRRGVARDLALMLGVSDIEESARFYGSHAGTRFVSAMLALRSSAGWREGMAAAEPLLAAARQRIARRVAAATVPAPRPGSRR